MDGLIEFTSNFLQEALLGAENVVVSPFSLYSVLFVLWIGGNGKTSEDIASVMKIKSDAPKLFLQNSNDSTFLTASRVYVSDGVQIAPQFNQFAESVDFSQRTTVSKINNWVKDTTQGKIVDFLEGKEVDFDTVMFLVNVMYFKGLWLKPFDSVSEGKFHNFDGSEATVEFINDIRKFNNTWLPKYQTHVVEIPYYGTDIVMLICFPKNSNYLEMLIRNISDAQKDIFNVKTTTYLSLSFPKFSINGYTVLDTILKKLGMAIAYSNEADFSNLIKGAVKLSSARQKTVIEVNEKGTEAAAGSGVDVIPRMSIDALICDHPFLFYLFDKVKQIPILTGVVRDLTSINT